MNAKRKLRPSRTRGGESTPGRSPENEDLGLKPRSGEGQWHRPPRALADRVRRFPADAPAPPRSDHTESLAWMPSDVRSGSDVRNAGEPVLLSRILDDGELAITAVVPEDGGAWSFTGRVWLHDDAGGKAQVKVLLVHDDHVLSDITVKSGEFFEFEEVVAEGWSIEVHMPNDSTLVLDDPTA